MWLNEILKRKGGGRGIRRPLEGDSIERKALNVPNWVWYGLLSEAREHRISRSRVFYTAMKKYLVRSCPGLGEKHVIGRLNLYDKRRYVMYVKNVNSEKQETTRIRIPLWMWLAVTDVSKSLDVGRNAVLKQAIKEYLDAYRPDCAAAPKSAEADKEKMRGINYRDWNAHLQPEKFDETDY